MHQARARPGPHRQSLHGAHALAVEENAQGQPLPGLSTLLIEDEIPQAVGDEPITATHNPGFLEKPDVPAIGGSALHHMRVMSDDQVCACPQHRLGRGALSGIGMVFVLVAPMHGDDHGIGLDAGSGDGCQGPFLIPVRHHPLFGWQTSEVCARRIWHVIEGQERQPHPVYVAYDRLAGDVDVGGGCHAERLDAGRLQGGDGVVQSRASEVQGVVVGQAEDVEPGIAQTGRRRWGHWQQVVGALSRRLRRRGRGFGDDALQVAQCQVSSPEPGSHIGQGVGPARYAPAQHQVAHDHQLHCRFVGRWRAPVAQHQPGIDGQVRHRWLRLRRHPADQCQQCQQPAQGAQQASQRPSHTAGFASTQPSAISSQPEAESRSLKADGYDSQGGGWLA